MTEKCPRCGSDLKVAPGIGPFCPNGACGVADDIKGGAGWQDQIHQAIEDGRNRKWAEAHPEIIAGLRDGSLVAVPTLGSTLMHTTIAHAHHMSETQVAAIWRGCLAVFHPDVMARAITEADSRVAAILAASKEPRDE